MYCCCDWSEESSGDPLTGYSCVVFVSVSLGGEWWCAETVCRSVLDFVPSSSDEFPVGADLTVASETCASAYDSKICGTGASTIDYNACEMSGTADCVHTSYDGYAPCLGIVVETAVDF